MEIHNVLRHPLSTEKSIRLMETENKLVFIVERKSKKDEIRKAFEAMFNIKPVNICTIINSKGKKKAFIKLPEEHPAIDVATQLGIM